MSATSGSEPLRALIVGCGAIAGGVPPKGGFACREPLTHAEAYARHEGFDLMACVDPDVERRAGFQRLWNVPHAFACLEEAFAALPDIDVVSICSPTSEHAAHLSLALEASVRAVLCEKPVAATVAETRDLCERALRKAIPVAVNFPRRWAPGIEALRRELDEGRWGAVRAITGVYTKGLRHNGSHMVDLMLQLFGKLRLVSVEGAVGGSGVDDPALDITLGLPGGALAHLTAADGRDYAVFELSVFTELGRILIDDLGFRITRQNVAESLRYQGFRVLGEGAAENSGLDQAMMAALDDVADAIRYGSTPRSCLATAFMGQTIIQEALDAHHSTTG